MAKVSKTIFPLLADSRFCNSLEVYGAYTNFFDVMNTHLRELSIAIDYDYSLYVADPVKGESEFFIELDETLKKQKFDTEYMIYWRSKYKKAFDRVKQAVGSDIDLESSYYQELSDSIGLLANPKFLLDDNTIPISDVFSTLYDQSSGFPVSLNNKISPAVKQLIGDMQVKTNAIYRSNILRIQAYYSNINTKFDQTKSHGYNLVTDYNAYLQRIRIAEGLIKALEDDYGKVFEVVQFLNTTGNQEGYNPRNLDKNLQRLSTPISETETSRIAWSGVKDSEDRTEPKYLFDNLHKKIVAYRKTQTNKGRLSVEGRTDKRQQLTTENVDNG